MHSNYDRLYPWVVVGLAVLIASGGIIGRIYTGPWLWAVHGVTVSAVALAALLPILRDRSTRETLEEARRELKVTVNDGLAPLAYSVGQVAQAESRRDRDMAAGTVYGQAVNVLAGLNDAKRARSTLYFIDEQQLTWTLAPRYNGGRHDAAHTKFVEGTEAGDAVRKMLEADDYVFCEDTDKDPPPGWDKTKVRSYRTFISVAVVARGKGVGMLTVNGIEPGDLSKDDVATTQVIASLVSTTYTLAKVAKRGRKRET